MIDIEFNLPLESILGIGIYLSGNNVYVSQLNFIITAGDFPGLFKIIGPIHNSSQSMISGSAGVLNYIMKPNPRTTATYDFMAGSFNQFYGSIDNCFLVKPGI